ncbi:MAG: CsbD family protein [Nitrospirae bacterium]|nr:CsbD family protein [Nitrospirota bacterium]
MNAYRLNGKWMQFKGELKQQWGKFTNDDLQQIEGSLDKILGQLQERDGGTCVSVVEGHDAGKKNELLISVQSIANAVGTIPLLPVAPQAEV